MDSEGRRERERGETRTRILDVARELFASEGVDHVTMRRIAQGLEYSAAALYRHFTDKAQLLDALVREDYAAFSERLMRTARAGTPLQRIKKIGEAYIQFGLTHRSHYRLLFMTPRPPRTTHELTAGMDSFGLLVATVQDAIDAKLLLPHLRDARMAALRLWEGVHGFVALRVAVDTDLGPVRAGQEMLLDTLIRGLARNP